MDHEIFDNDDVFCDQEGEKETVTIHPESAFYGMRRAGNLASRVLDFITPHVREGVTTEELNDLCHDFTIQNGALSAPLGYKGYPKSICTSVNHVVCHGIPGPQSLKKGDIVGIDVTVIVDGWYGDTCRTFVVGEVSKRAQKLVDTAYEAMMRGIDCVRPGAYLGDVGYAIQSFVESRGFSVVRDFCGHGIGRVFHADPYVLHVGPRGSGHRLQEGMFFTIEPMINAGRKNVVVLNDGWTAVTCDRSLSAQFEHTVGVTRDGVEIFTLSAS